MDFSILYTYEQECGTKNFIVPRRKGRVYIRPCKLDGYSRPVFRFLGKKWTAPFRVTLFPDTL